MKKVWRYDSYELSIKQVEVREDTPLNQWLYPFYGDGVYIYMEDLDKLKYTLKLDIEQQISNLEEKLENLLLY